MAFAVFAPRMRRAVARRRRDRKLGRPRPRAELGLTGGFVGGKAPGQVEFETIVRALPKCATEADLVSALRKALVAFRDAPASTLSALRSASTDPRRVLQTTPSGVYCIESQQRQQVWKAITAAFQGHAAEIAIDEVQREAFRELTDEIVDKLDPRKGLWDTIWQTFKPVALPLGIAGLTILGLRLIK